MYSLTLGGRPFLLIIAGAGSLNAFRAAQHLARNFSIAGLATVGFAGALDGSLRPGDVIAVEQVLDEATGDRFPCETSLLPVRCSRQGKLLSVNTVIASQATKRSLAQEWGAVAVDMEAAGVARAALAAGVPFCGVKSITDSVEQSLAIDFTRCQSEDKDLSLWAIMRQALTTARGTRDLWTLAWNARQAAGTLAAALNVG